MKKTLLNSLYVLVTLSSLFFIYLFFIFNPNDYKDEITSYISSKTKYDFRYNGEIEASYYPNIKFLMSGIQIFKISSEPKDIMIEVSSIDLSLSLEKLINNIIDVNHIKAYGLKYHGINADDILIKTYSLSKFSLFTGSGKKITNVKSMSAKAKIIDDNMKISNIYIETEIMEAKGSGFINLITKEAEFNFIGKIKKYENVISFYQNSYPKELMDEELPIMISGKLSNLSMSIDLSHIVMQKIEPIREKIIDEIQDKVINELRDKIKLPF